MGAKQTQGYFCLAKRTRYISILSFVIVWIGGPSLGLAQSPAPATNGSGSPLVRSFEQKIHSGKPFIFHFWANMTAGGVQGDNRRFLPVLGALSRAYKRDGLQVLALCAGSAQTEKWLRGQSGVDPSDSFVADEQSYHDISARLQKLTGEELEYTPTTYLFDAKGKLVTGIDFSDYGYSSSQSELETLYKRIRSELPQVTDAEGPQLAAGFWQLWKQGKATRYMKMAVSGAVLEATQPADKNNISHWQATIDFKPPLRTWRQEGNSVAVFDQGKEKEKFSFRQGKLISADHQEVGIRLSVDELPKDLQKRTEIVLKKGTTLKSEEGKVLGQVQRDGYQFNFADVDEY